MQWWQDSLPNQIMPIPWLHPDVTKYLEGILEPNFEVCEFGSGGSTLWFADRVKQVVSYENDYDWAQAVKRHVADNVKLVSYAVFPDHSFDLLLIDGEPVEERSTWILAAEWLVKPGGWIVLDNANRPEYARERECLPDFAEFVKGFDGNGNVGKYLVTEFYKRKAGMNESWKQSLKATVG